MNKNNKTASGDKLIRIGRLCIYWAKCRDNRGGIGEVVMEKGKRIFIGKSMHMKECRLGMRLDSTVCVWGCGGVGWGGVSAWSREAREFSLSLSLSSYVYIYIMTITTASLPFVFIS